MFNAIKAKLIFFKGTKVKYWTKSNLKRKKEKQSFTTYVGTK